MDNTLNIVSFIGFSVVSHSDVTVIWCLSIIHVMLSKNYFMDFA